MVTSVSNKTQEDSYAVTLTGFTSQGTKMGDEKSLTN